MDLFAMVRRRRAAFAVAFVLVLLTGAVVTVRAAPQYSATVEIIPLQHEALLRGWLASRQAASWVAQQAGERLEDVLGPNPARDHGLPLSGHEGGSGSLGERLHKRVEAKMVIDSRTRESVIRLTVTLPHDPGLSAHVAQRYVESLQLLRPHLERLTVAERFERYYNEVRNEQAARERAEIHARVQEYWMVFDSASIPMSPSKPDIGLNATLTVFAATATGFVGALAAEAYARSRRMQVATARGGDVHEPERPLTTFQPVDHATRRPR